MKIIFFIALALLSSLWRIAAGTNKIARGFQHEEQQHRPLHSQRNLTTLGNHIGQTQSRRTKKGDESDESSSTDRSGEQSISCVLVEAVFLFREDHKPAEEKEREEWRCEFVEEDNSIKVIHGLPEDFFSRSRGQIESGKTLLTVIFPSDMVATNINTPEIMFVPEGARLRLSSVPESSAAVLRHRRTTMATEGNHTILVIRVTDVNGIAPVRTAMDIRGDIFGYYDDPHNLRSQYRACSGGKLDFVPGSGDYIDRGVFELQVPYSVDGITSSQVENMVSAVARTALGPLDQWDVVMYILPNAVDFEGTAAYTYVGSHHSVFLDQYSSNLLVLMHEVGHNLGNRHSGEGGKSYDDGTCMMGSHLYEDDAPRMCFNGAKSWNFGWYSDRHVAADPSIASAQGMLVGVDDYVNGQTNVSHAVVARVVSHATNDLYMMFNRKEGVNSQVQDKPNLVTIVEQGARGDQSWLLAGISEKTLPFRYKNFNHGEDLVVEVCKRGKGIPDYALIMIYLDDEANRLYCEGHIPGSKKVGLEVMSEDGDYREKSNGVIKQSQTVHTMFGSNWYLHGLRFEPAGIGQIPPNAQIISAKLYVRAMDDDRYFDGQLFGYAVGHASGDPPSHSGDSYYITNAPKTVSKVFIDPNLPTWSAIEDEELVDVAPIVQEIVNRNDYNEGNPIEIFLVGTADGGIRKTLTTEGGFKTRIIVTYLQSNDILPMPPSHQQEEHEIQVEVSNSKDDFKESKTGAVGTGSKSHVLFASSHERHAYRFVNVPVPQGATILEARLELVGRSGSSLDRDMKGTIQGEKVGNSAPFKYETFQLLNADKTDAVVKIENLPSWEEDKYNSVGDISPIIQELVDRTDYSYGNAMKIILLNDGTKSGRRVRTFDNGYPPRLIVRYRF